ncbi:MAG: alpha-glucosidase, partial [Promicromonosporaceae bacterium]|nr:alpha-glucosidase [Promicromonosporaceae bacterium]
MTITLNSRLKDIYANPIGHDAVAKILLQIGAPSSLISNPIVANLKLGQVQRLASAANVPEGFFDSLLDLLNSETELPTSGPAEVEPKWWKESVFYQIYPRSFQDSDGDGVGDLGGIINRLDYLKSLGVDALWLSPIYDSPNDDNGYDIRDYREIMSEFGTMAQFDELLAGIHERGMKLIMDLVVNHTSDEHEWFQKALAGDKYYQDFYIFRPGAKPGSPEEGGEPPNNWTSFFSGPAWNYYPELGKWGLHLFTKKQMDLNWENPNVRAAIVEMVNWWLAKGVDGFRLDVINYISKAKGLPDGDVTIGGLMGFKGVEKYYFGPHLHEYLHQLNVEAFAPHDAFSVGETPGIGIEMSKLLTQASRQELDTVFNFDQLENPGKTKFDDYEYDLNYLKKYLMEWTEDYPNDSWMSLFYDNHDNPRMLSKVSEDPEYRELIAKLLGVIQMTSKGTPFLFQGQEIGMANQRFTDITELRDVESVNLFQELLDEGKSEAEAFARVRAGSRDHARVPMQWDESAHAGFTTGTPWIVSDGDYLDWNVATEEKDADSVINFYRKLI